MTRESGAKANKTWPTNGETTEMRAMIKSRSFLVWLKQSILPKIGRTMSRTTLLPAVCTPRFTTRLSVIWFPDSGTKPNLHET